MFDKILIANRGEIACRVMRTARRLGIRSVAVYSEADRDALHVAMADEAHFIGPAPALKSYLDIDAILAALRASGAEAVHPGYGFLSENADFAAALEAAGIAFIGPNRRAVELMGDKIASKALAVAAGVPTVPGTAGATASLAEAEAAALAIGYPVMIKASAGGGGKGMRVAHDAGELSEGFASAVGEATAAFGDGRVFVEKYVLSPRHIEIQVLGDRHGNVIHLGERECSVQRRNQKVIEEAPSAFVDEALRAAMGQAAVALAREVDYDSAGTVEFIVDPERNFYFLEMNTRLQVEHPVTELTTGIDLVEQMIRVAAGEALAIGTCEVERRGWAIEARLYAEDPARGFMPSVGRLVRYREPDGVAGEGRLRIDSGVVEGGAITVHYDPMIAKVCVHAQSREAATDGLIDALDRFSLTGIDSNLAFLSAVLDHPRWRAGDISTHLLAEIFPDGFAAAPDDPATCEAMVAIAALCDHLAEARRRRAGGLATLSRTRTVLIAGVAHEVQVGPDGANRYAVEIDGRPHALATDWRPGAAILAGELDARPVAAEIARIGGGYAIRHRAALAICLVLGAREAEMLALMPEKAPPDTSRVVICPMPGTLVRLAVAQGQAVKAGEALCVVEAMKMENVLKAGRDGIVGTVRAAPGDALSVGSIIMEFA